MSLASLLSCTSSFLAHVDSPPTLPGLAVLLRSPTAVPGERVSHLGAGCWDFCPSLRIPTHFSLFSTSLFPPHYFFTQLFQPGEGRSLDVQGCAPKPEGALVPSTVGDFVLGLPLVRSEAVPGAVCVHGEIQAAGEIHLTW